MLKKIEDRLNKEIEKILEKEELSIPDYFFLSSQLVNLRLEKKSEDIRFDTNELLNKGIEVLADMRGDKECNKETSQV